MADAPDQTDAPTTKHVARPGWTAQPPTAQERGPDLQPDSSLTSFTTLHPPAPPPPTLPFEAVAAGQTSAPAKAMLVLCASLLMSGDSMEKLGKVPAARSASKPSRPTMLAQRVAFSRMLSKLMNGLCLR